MRRSPARMLPWIAGVILPTLAAGPPAGPSPVRPVSWNEARPIVERLAGDLPATLGAILPGERPARWTSWIKAQEQVVLARLARGEEDSLVNLLLFGTSFTTQPRVTPAFLADLDRRWRTGDRTAAEERLTRVYRQRASDLVAAIVKPGADERMRFAGSVLERLGYRLSAPDGRGAAINYLLASVARVGQESAALAQALEQARTRPDSTTAFADRSRLFRQRGLAPDSSVMTQFAVDRALQVLRERGLLVPAGVRRVAIVGPGLDFVDKQEGFDFYPPQSLQPFATVDSLLRSGLARPGTLNITTIDISRRVLTHLEGAADRARRQKMGYRLVLPLNAAESWAVDALAYWRVLGDRIGASINVDVPAVLPGVRARGVIVKPDVVSRIETIAANIVYDRIERAPEELFDLVIATNVLVYYDTFEQTLALASLAAMIRPGGLLVSNNSLLEVPEVPMKSSGYVTVRFSDREGDGEHMVFYERVRSR